MRIKNLNFNLTEFAAVATWMIVFGLSMLWLSNNFAHYTGNIPTVVIGFLVYLTCFLLIVREVVNKDSFNVFISVVLLQLLSAFVLMWLLPLDFLSILTIIWIAILPHFLSLTRTILLMLLVVVCWFSLSGYRWGSEHVFYQALLYTSFHFFALLMSVQTTRAESASLEAQRLNQELVSTQYLLAEASRQNERTRIARDLHDLLGHHLTALIINLQVAGHLTDGEAKAKVEQCHSLAKLLLSDVRDAVSSIKQSQNFDFKKVLQLMLDNTPRLNIHLQLNAQFDLEELTLAKAILSSIQESLTNSLRHSHATDFWIDLNKDKNNLSLKLHDNGKVNGKISCGNGLNGMRQRITELGGELNIQTINQALHINIDFTSLPIKA